MASTITFVCTCLRFECLGKIGYHFRQAYTFIQRVFAYRVVIFVRVADLYLVG